MNKIVFILLFCFTLCAQGLAQQEVQFTQFMYNKLYYNPAYAGIGGGASIKAMYRSQWLGFDGAPKSRLVSFDAPLFDNRVGFGLTFVSHQQGITSTWQTSMAYSYGIQIENDLTLRFGFQGSLRYYGIDFTDPDFLILQKNDPSILENMTTQNYYGNFGVGTYLLYKQAYFGFSIPNFYSNDIGFNTANLSTFAKEVKHFYAMAGVSFEVGQNLIFRPSILAKYVRHAPFDLETNFSLTYNETLTFGTTYRAGGDRGGESVDLLILYQLNKIALGLAYDIPISPIKNHSNGSIEALIRYDFLPERSNITNPRFFF